MSINIKLPIKTVSIKVKLSKEQADRFDYLTTDLTWLWNKILANELNNHCLKWYNWAEKQGVDLNGIIKVPLKFGRNAFVGAACQIAYGGNYWKIDDDSPATIEYKNKSGEIQYKKPYKLMPGDKPYTRIPIQEFQYQKLCGKDMENSGNFCNLARIDELRKKEGLPNFLKNTSNCLKGIVSQFNESIKGWKNPSRPTSKKPLFKDKSDKVKSIYDPQDPPTLVDSNTFDTQAIKGIKIADKSAIRRLNLDNMVMRSSTLCKKLSGYYLNIAIACSAQAMIPTIDLRYKNAKKINSESEETLNLKEELQQLKLKVENYGKIERNNLACGIDPGVKAIVATDHGALFNPNLSRERVAHQIQSTQQKLDEIKLINDKKWNNDKKIGIIKKHDVWGNENPLYKKRELTKNEVKLKERIARLHEKGASSGRHFNHKLSTRLTRTYGTIIWENTQLKNMTKKAAPKADPNSIGFLPNNGHAKSGLNRALLSRAIGDLRAKVEEKTKILGTVFELVDAKNTSIKCHCCGEKGDRVSQSVFKCLNDDCNLFGIEQHADVNASKNIKKKLTIVEPAPIVEKTPNVINLNDVKSEKQKEVWTQLNLFN